METVIFDAGLTREVQPRSCDQCYSKKSRCSRHLPCQACVSSRLHCSYKRRTHYQRKNKLDQRRRQPGGQSGPLRAEDGELEQSPTSLPGVEPSTEARAWPPTPMDGASYGAAGGYSTPSLESVLVDTPESSMMPGATWDIDQATASAGRVSKQPGYRNTPHQDTGLGNVDTAWDQLFAPFATSFFPTDSACTHTNCAVVGPVPQPQPDLGPYLSPVDDDDTLLGSLAVIFLDRLHPSMPFFKRSYLLDNMRLRRHDHDPSFNALVHAICALTLLQPIQAPDQALFPNREEQAESFLSEAVRLHSSTDFGENPTLENVLTSIFLFACQFGRRNHNAARFRLREAAALAEIMKLGDVQGYCGMMPDERDRRLRTVLCLTMLERVYAIQRPYPFDEGSLVGSRIRTIQDMLEQGYVDYEPRDLRAISGLGDMIESFEFVDNRLLRCWRNECWRLSGGAGANDRHVSPATVCALLRRYAAPVATTGARNSDTQRADILITRHWIRSVLWNLALRHGFVSEASDGRELHPEYAVSIASDAIETCDAFSMGVLEVHGIGLTEKLHDIAVTAIGVFERRKNGSSVPGAETPVITHRPPPPQHRFERQDYSPSEASSPGVLVPEHASSPSHMLNRYLALFASFRGGQHPFLKPYVQRLCRLDLFVA